MRISYARCAAATVILLAFLDFLCPTAQAQSTFGSMRGTAMDQSGAAIPAIQIRLHNEGENTDLTTTSDPQGNFLLENLKPGHYTLVASKEGFATATIKQLELAARQDLRVDVTLNLASQAQTIEVSAAAETINTENGTLSSAVTNEDLNTLPLNSRAVSSSPLAALALSPDVVKDNQGNIAVGGATSAQTGFSVDGISTASVRANGALQDAYPSQEGISEMKVTAFNNNAEFAQIGDVTFTTKSGTNDWHGSAFEYFQSDALDSTIYGFTSKAPKTFNTFGGSLGGPVIIPGVWNGRNKKTFFFADYEGNRKTTSAPEYLLVPTQVERSGNLNALVTALANGPVIDPFTGNPYPNNTIPPCTVPGPGGPTDCLNPVTQKLLNAWYPQPNANLNVANPAFNYQTLVPIPSNSNGWDLRVDQQLTPKQQIYGRYSWKNVFVTESNSAGVIAPANNFLPNDEAHEQNRTFVFSYNYVLTTNLLNEFRFGFTNFTENDTFPLSGPQSDVGTGPGELGLVESTIPFQFLAQPTGHAFPTFNFLDGTITDIGQDRVGTTLSKTYQFTDNFTIIKHSHTMRFGFDTRRVLYNALMFYYASDDYGQFNFSGTLTSCQPGQACGTPGGPCFTQVCGGYSLGDFLLGMPQTNFAITGGPQVNAYTWHSGVYGQDEWQVNSRLTVNFGLRWEVQPAMVETNGDLASFVPALNSIVVPNKFFSMLKTYPPATPVYVGTLESYNGCSLTNYGVTPDPSLPCTNVMSASQAGLPQGLRYTDLHDFDPRVSIAYRPFNNEKTVIRAGFGLYTMTTLGPMSFNNAMVGVSALVSYSNPYPVTNTIFQLPDATPPNAAIQFGGGAFEEANNPHWKDPSSAQWNLTVERQVTTNTSVRLSYVGQSSWHLPITVDLNQVPASKTPYSQSEAPYPQFNLLMSSESIGNASYQAGIAEVQHTFSHGLAFLGSYTWAKNISDAQGSDAPTGFASEEPYAVEIANRFDLRYDRGNVVGTPTQRFLLTGTYELPYGHGRHWTGGGSVLNAVFGGWNFSTVTLLQTGQWLTPTMNATADQSNTNMVIRNTQGSAMARPDCVGNPIPENRTRSNYYDLSAFAFPPTDAGRFGTCGLGILEGPGESNVNMGLAKVIPVKERYHLRFEASFTNVLNHTNFAPPALNLSSPSTFGQLVAALPQGNGGNRTGQLAVRLDF